MNQTAQSGVATDGNRLLGPEETPPFRVERAGARGPFLLVCEHAGRVVPRRLGTLGLAPHHFERHIAYDLGALELARALAARLDAPLVWQPYSRLVCDCNRRPEAASFISELSEDTPIPGNRGLSPEERRRRIEEVFRPFHDRVRELLERQLSAREGRLVFVTVHSFTPVFLGERREMEVGLLFNRHPQVARRVGPLLEARGVRLAYNAPYAMSDEEDFTVPFHAERRGLPSLEIEVRQDLLARQGDIERWAGVLAEALAAAVPAVLASAPHPHGRDIRQARSADGAAGPSPSPPADSASGRRGARS